MAQKTQEEDKEGIARMQRMVHESEEIGVATNIKLKMQMEGADPEVLSMDPEAPSPNAGAVAVTEE